MSDEQQPTGHLFPSTALRRVHAIMIGSAIAFAAGFVFCFFFDAAFFDAFFVAFFFPNP